MHNEDYSFDRRNRFGTDLTPANVPATISPIANLPMPRPLGITGWMAANASTRMMQTASVEAMHEQCRMLLTKTALENVALLSAMEAQFNATTPNGQERYRLIVDAYTVSTAMNLARW